MKKLKKGPIQKWGEKIEIAEGVFPTQGNDAELEFYFENDKSLRPQITEDGHIDYKEVHFVDSVENRPTWAYYPRFHQRPSDSSLSENSGVGPGRLVNWLRCVPLAQIKIF